jgi:hypothetical protein
LLKNKKIKNERINTKLKPSGEKRISKMKRGRIEAITTECNNTTNLIL